jgi:hypothetical protein
MEYKNLSLEELKALKHEDMDDVELGEWLKAYSKKVNVNIDANKEQKLADTLADSEAMKVANQKATPKLVSKRSKDTKVSFILKVNGSIEDWTYGSAIRGAVAENSFKGCMFLIDNQTDVIFTSDSDLNWGEFNTTDLVKLAYAKRVVAYFGYAARKTEFRKDGVTKTSEASATEVIKALTEDEMERVAVVKDNEIITLVDYLASLE